MRERIRDSSILLRARSLRSVLVVATTLLLIIVALYVTPDPLLH